MNNCTSILFVEVADSYTIDLICLVPACKCLIVFALRLIFLGIYPTNVKLLAHSIPIYSIYV